MLSSIVLRITDAIIHSKKRERRNSDSQPPVERVIEAIWTPLIIAVPGLLQWPLQMFVRTAPLEAVILDALGMLVGVAYMLSLAPLHRRVPIVDDERFRRKYPITSIYAAKKISAEEFLLLATFISILAACYYLDYPWPLGTNWTILTYCAIFAALFDRGAGEPGAFASSMLLTLTIVATLVPSFFFVAKASSVLYHPAPIAVYIFVSTGIGVMVQSQRSRMKDQIRRSQTEARFVENRVRQEISHELHDVVAHEVAGIVVLSQATKMVHASGTASPEYIDDALAKIEMASTRALASIRATVEDLRKSDTRREVKLTTSFPEIVEIIDKFKENRQVGRVNSVDDVVGVGDVATDAGVGAACSDGSGGAGPVIVDIDEKTREYLSPSRGLFSEEMGNTLYRVMSESLTNIYRHSPNSNVFISVRVGLLPKKMTEVFEEKPIDTSSVMGFSRDTFLAAHPEISQNVSYPRVELFVFDTGSNDSVDEPKSIGGGNGIGIENIRRNVRELGGVVYTGAYRPLAVRDTDARPGWLVFSTIPLKK